MSNQLGSMHPCTCHCRTKEPPETPNLMMRPHLGPDSLTDLRPIKRSLNSDKDNYRKHLYDARPYLYVPFFCFIYAAVNIFDVLRVVRIESTFFGPLQNYFLATASDVVRRTKAEDTTDSFLRRPCCNSTSCERPNSIRASCI